MSGKQVKNERRAAEQQKQVRVSAKISIPPAKLAPIIANLNALRITENPEKIKDEIVAQMNALIDESFHVGMKVGRIALLKEIDQNKGMIQKPGSRLIVPAHVAAQRQTEKKGNGDDSKG